MSLWLVYKLPIGSVYQLVPPRQKSMCINSAYFVYEACCTHRLATAGYLSPFKGKFKGSDF